MTLVKAHNILMPFSDLAEHLTIDHQMKAQLSLIARCPSFSNQESHPISFLAALMLLALIALPSPAANVASDSGCNDTIANNNNGGFGFDAWTNVSINSAGGLYTTTDTSLGSNGCPTAWGIYTGTSTGTTSMQRPLANYAALSVGQTIMVDMHNGGIQTAGGGSEGMTLFNSASNILWQLYFIGGQNSWTTNANGGAGTTTIPYAGSSGACRVFFTLTSATTWSLTAQVPIGGTNYGPFTGTLLNPAGGQSIAMLGFFTTDIGSGNNIQVNNLGVGYDTPTISAQPAATTTTSYGANTSAMTVTGASTDASTVGYAWRKRGSGWGNAWTFDNTAGSGAGSVFLASSPEIDTGGQAWGLQQTANTSATDAIRPLPSTLNANQTVSLDMDNKSIGVNGSVGFGLQDSSGNNGFEFYFAGGSANYSIGDYSGTARNTAVPFTSTGLHLDFTLTSATNYTLRIKRLSNGSTIVLTGSVTNHSLSHIRFFDFESGGGNNAYFNNLAVAGADDNAGNYSGSWSGDKGQKPLADGLTATGSTNSGSATASFTIQNAQVADNASYDCAVMSGQGLTVLSSATALTASKATPVLTAPAAGSITYGQTLASASLTGGTATNSNNSASVAGTFAFTPPGTAPGAGTAGQNITFTPTDTTDYNTATTSANVTVGKATPMLTAPTASAITYGQTLASSHLDRRRGDQLQQQRLRRQALLCLHVARHCAGSRHCQPECHVHAGRRDRLHYHPDHHDRDRKRNPHFHFAGLIEKPIRLQGQCYVYREFACRRHRPGYVSDQWRGI